MIQQTTQTVLQLPVPIRIGDRVAVTYHGEKGFEGRVCFVGKKKDHSGILRAQVGVRFSVDGPRWMFFPSEVEVLF